MNDDALDPRIAQRLARAAHAAQELSDALWDALREELADPRRERVAELSRRLVAVAGTVSTLTRGEASQTAGRREPAGPARLPQPDFPLATPGTLPGRERPASAAVLVDELAADGDVEAYSPRAAPAPAGLRAGLAVTRAAVDRARCRRRQPACAPPEATASGDSAGAPSVGVLGTLPTTRVTIRTVSSMPSSSAARAVRSQFAPMLL